jgi:hypothetical protein
MKLYKGQKSPNFDPKQMNILSPELTILTHSVVDKVKLVMQRVVAENILDLKQMS